METERDPAGGEVVYLLAELQSARRGPVHEIGARARVLENDGELLTLEVGEGPAVDVVTCSSNLVACRRRSFTARRQLRTSGPALA